MMTITASGGPFREWSAERIASATRGEALAHPKWVMGPKVTVDSAGLMNKGLELIEAHFLVRHCRRNGSTSSSIRNRSSTA